MHSVDTFIHQFKTNYPGVVCPSTPTVYRYIDDQRLAIRNSDLPAKLRRRVKRPGTKHHRINKKNLGHSIEERPTVVQARQEFGHWESDLVKGKRVESEPALMTLTERVSRLEIIVKLPNYHADTCLKALQNTLYDYGTEYFKTITFDNGAEFSSLSQVAGTDIYFAILIHHGNAEPMRTLTAFCASSSRRVDSWFWPHSLIFSWLRIP